MRRKKIIGHLLIFDLNCFRLKQRRKKMQALNQSHVDECVKIAVPTIADHIIEKARRNNGFAENPKAVHPVTKVLTLGLDSQTRFQIQMELIKASKLSLEKGLHQIAFIRACMECVDENMVHDIVGCDEHLCADDVWITLDEMCSRDGTVFLATLDGMSGPELSSCKRFVEHFAPTS